MEFIRGKHAVGVDPATFARQIVGYPHVLIDLGTGDGRFVRHIATTSPDTFAIGIDLCADNLRKESRRAPANALYLIASAYAPPPELRGRRRDRRISAPVRPLGDGTNGRAHGSEAADRRRAGYVPPLGAARVPVA